MKNYFTTLLLLLAFSTACLAQKDFAFGIDYFPNYSINTNASPVIKKSQEGKVSFSIGLTAIKNINERLSVHTGLYYANIGTRAETNGLRWGVQHDGQGGFNPDIDNGEDFDNITYIYSLQFVEIPLKIKYVLVNKKYQLYTSQAIIGRYFINERQKTVLEGEDNRTTRKSTLDTKFNSISPALQTAIGISIPINNHVQCYLEPRCQLNFMVLHDELLDTKKEVHFLSIGLGAGIQFGN